MARLSPCSITIRTSEPCKHPSTYLTRLQNRLLSRSSRRSERARSVENEMGGGMEECQDQPNVVVYRLSSHQVCLELQQWARNRDPIVRNRTNNSERVRLIISQLMNIKQNFHLPPMAHATATATNTLDCHLEWRTCAAWEMTDYSIAPKCCPEAAEEKRGRKV
jgi:hypothetical protein